MLHILTQMRPVCRRLCDGKKFMKIIMGEW